MAKPSASDTYGFPLFAIFALLGLTRYQSEQSSKKQRKARTRTLIQLGGLVHKVGLSEEFRIALGEDLQMDEAAREKNQKTGRVVVRMLLK